MEIDGDFQFNLEMEAPELKPTTVPLFLEKVRTTLVSSFVVHSIVFYRVVSCVNLLHLKPCLLRKRRMSFSKIRST